MRNGSMLVVVQMLIGALPLPAADLEAVTSPSTVACSCGDRRVCGTGGANDPFRCCNLARDSCNVFAGNNPCEPMRCGVEPECCVFFFEPCLDDFYCGGRAGSCDLALQLCVAPCDPLINNQCGGASRTCLRYRGTSYQVPDETPCDDGMICTAASPEPTLVDCVGTDGTGGGPACTRDRPLSGASGLDCPATAPICSGSDSTLGGNGGAIVGGRCCPEGTACDLLSGKCRGNFGAGADSRDVCLAGTCIYDDPDSCPASDEAAADASLRASLLFGSTVQVSWTPACKATDHVLYWGTGLIAPSPTWTGALCALGTVGVGTFDPGAGPPGTLDYFVVVGRTPFSEGSYGRASTGAERPESVGLGGCDLGQMIVPPCGP